jgi:hypothetical protein
MRGAMAATYLARYRCLDGRSINRACTQAKLRDYMRLKNVSLEDNVYGLRACVVKATWTETDKHSA